MQSNFGKKGLIWFTYSESQSIERSQDKNSNLAERMELRERPWRSAAYGLTPHIKFSVLIKPGPLSQDSVPTHKGLGLLQPRLIKKMSYGLTYSPILQSLLLS